MTIQQHGKSSTTCLNLSSIIYSSQATQSLKKKGKCEYFDRTKYADGILPIDTYKRDIDEFCGTELNYDWESLRVSITTHGLRHSTLSAQMPSESSSVVSNATNGIEPPRAFCPLRKAKRDRSNRSFLSMVVSRITTLFSGT